MTLILTQASKDYVLQVTDRLVTGNRQPYDELANKNILYCASNAIVVMGYTGIAFIGNVPTDQWIVEALTGHTFDRQDRPSMVTGEFPSFDLGRSLQRLQRAFENPPISAKWRTQWVASSFDLCIAGWQWRRSGFRFRPVIARFNKACKSTAFEVACAKRYWFCDRTPFEAGPRRSFKVKIGAFPKANLSREELKQVFDRTHGHDADGVETVLVQAVRNVAERLPEVGPHCIGILLTPPTVRYARVRYFPASGSAQAKFSSSTAGAFCVPVAFSPWLVGPRTIVPPSVLAGQVIFHLGPYTVELQAPSPPSDLVAIFTSQPRRPMP